MAYHNNNNNKGKVGYVYILANFNRNVLYIGVTSDLLERIWNHRIGKGSQFTGKYNVKYLMHIEKYPNINDAIHRKKQLKN